MIDHSSLMEKSPPISAELATIIAATATTMGSFGLVIAGTWMINLVVQ